MSTLKDKETGADTLHFAEYPLCLIAERAPQGLTKVSYQDTVTDPRSGKLVVRKLVIEGHPDHGLPTATDDDVLVAFLKLTRDAGFSSTRVYFTGVGLIELMGWPFNGKSYKRLLQSIKRWWKTGLSYENAWWSEPGRCWMDQHVVVFQDYTAPSQVGPGRPRRDRSVVCYIEWSNTIFASLQSGFWKPLDTEIYFGLKSSVSRRLMRFCDLRFRQNLSVEIDLDELATKKIGLKDGYAPSKIRRIIEPAILELVEVGFLARCDLNSLYTRVSRSSWIITLSPPAKPPAPPHPLVTSLIEHGVMRTAATRLVETFDEERIVRQIAHLDWRIKQKMPHTNPGGWLNKAIADDYPLPDAYHSAVKRESQRELMFTVREKEIQDRSSQRQLLDKVDRHLASLTPAQLAALDSDALASVGEEQRRDYENARPILKKTFMKAIREEYVRERLIGKPTT